MGLVTVEDIIEEIVGKFTTTLRAAPRRSPGRGRHRHRRRRDDRARGERALGLSLPVDGPRTLNGLIVEYLQEIPEADVAIKIGNVPIEIVHAQGRTWKTVRIFRPVEPVEKYRSSET